MAGAGALDSAGVSGKFNTQPLLSLLRASDEQVADLRYRGLALTLTLTRTRTTDPDSDSDPDPQ
tara:strand:+ start:308 stop:499 length:192 start_codon:yes stop_codon:yes gene_type:complete